MTQPDSKKENAIGLGEQIGHIAGLLSHLSTGDLAMLRRGPLRNGEAGAPAFWVLSAKYGFSASQQEPRQQEQWAAIIQAMALLTKRKPDGKGHESPHDGKKRFGAALCGGGKKDWSGEGELRPALSELRLARLLNNHGKQRREGLVRAVRMLARSDMPVNCVDIASFILARPDNDKPARAIAENYYRRLDGANAKATKATV